MLPQASHLNGFPQMSVRTHSTNLNSDEKMSCISYASTHQGDSSFREYFSHAWFRSLHEWVGVFIYENKWIFHEYQSHVFFFWKSQKWPFDNVLLGTGRDSCSRQCVRLVAALSLRADTFYRCLRCLKQHQAQLVNKPDMYLLSTLDDTIDISWFGNCYHKKNNVCFICFNIPKYWFQSDLML